MINVYEKLKMFVYQLKQNKYMFYKPILVIVGDLNRP